MYSCTLKQQTLSVEINDLNRWLHYIYELDILIYQILKTISKFNVKPIFKFNVLSIKTATNYKN
jgi:hypothetical protein